MVDVHVKYRGLIKDRMPSGNVRYLVRVKGQPNKRITLPVGPEHKDFHEQYLAARMGVQAARTERSHAAGTLGWLVDSYLSHLRSLCAAGQASPLTLKQRDPFGKELKAAVSTSRNSMGKPYATLPLSIPQDELARFLDTFTATPGKAKNMLKFLRALFVWGVSRGHCSVNPAAGLSVAYTNKGGATPWTVDDLNKYRKAHPKGTMAHLTLSLFMFTACRIGDAYRLGRGNETTVSGQQWIGWQPAKRGSRYVEIPMLPPLLEATRAQRVIGPTYLLSSHGVPFKSAEGLRNRLSKWCDEAGIKDRSSHGIRKAAGHLLSLNGATQYEIMSIHGHANASTSEVYTRGADRQRLAASAASKLAGMDW